MPENSNFYFNSYFKILKIEECLVYLMKSKITYF